ncbi:MAG TPA: phosphoribosylformylglycinamidine synthase subunit PurS [Candidatus Eisenbacteria bacterium]|nr:phosphoribosylformylglycinamidine synthase subunit PurS [Candidatus Eisenbacteria bacterium]
MTFRAEVFVTPKAVVNDPQGLTIRQGLRSLGFEGVQDVRSGKYLVLTLESPDRDTALARLDDMARTLLANAVIEDYRIELAPVRETVAP